jgi:hypothetical protein
MQEAEGVIPHNLPLPPPAITNTSVGLLQSTGFQYRLCPLQKCPQTQIGNVWFSFSKLHFVELYFLIQLA